MAVTHFRPLRPATCLLIAFLIRIPTPAHSADPAPDPGPSKTTPVAKTAAQKQAEKQAEIDRDRQATAVALNYSTPLGFQIAYHTARANSRVENGNVFRLDEPYRIILMYCV